MPSVDSLAQPSSLPEAPVSGVRLVAAPRAPALCYPAEVMEGTDPLLPLALGARAGDAAAARALLRAIGPALLSVVRKILGSGHPDTEDVLQEALVGVIDALGSFREEASVLHFARAIALRRALDQKRRGHRLAVEIDLHDDAALDERSPKGDLVAERRRRAFRALLDELRPEQAEAFALHVLFGASVPEIAAETGVPPETVRSRLRLAKAALRDRFANDPMLRDLAEMNDDDAP